MKHDNEWYSTLARELEHPGYVTLAEIRQAEAREARETAVSAIWGHPSGSDIYWTEQDGACYVIKRDLHDSRRRTWMIEAWPSGLTGERYLRTQTGIKTLAEAKGLALAQPCTRCGLASPLVLMTRVLPQRPGQRTGPKPRYRCLDESICLAERGRLTGTEPARMEVTA